MNMVKSLAMQQVKKQKYTISGILLLCGIIVIAASFFMERWVIWFGILIVVFSVILFIAFHKSEQKLREHWGSFSQSELFEIDQAWEDSLQLSSKAALNRKYLIELSTGVFPTAGINKVRAVGGSLFFSSTHYPAPIVINMPAREQLKNRDLIVSIVREANPEVEIKYFGD